MFLHVNKKARRNFFARLSSPMDDLRDEAWALPLDELRDRIEFYQFLDAEMLTKQMQSEISICAQRSADAEMQVAAVAPSPPAPTKGAASRKKRQHTTGSGSDENTTTMRSPRKSPSSKRMARVLSPVKSQNQQQHASGGSPHLNSPAKCSPREPKHHATSTSASISSSSSNNNNNNISSCIRGCHRRGSGAR